MEYPNNKMGPGYYNENQIETQSSNGTVEGELNIWGYLIIMFILMVFCSLVLNGSEEELTVQKPLLKKEKANIKLFSDECVICLENYESNKKITTLKCDHIFHYDCINEWFDTNQSCPLCRIDLL